MSIDLRMEPYATMFENERPESRIIPELCVPDITDKLCDRLGLSWYEFHAVADEEEGPPAARSRPETPARRSSRVAL